MYTKAIAAVATVFTLAGLWYFGYLGRLGGGIPDGPASSQLIATLTLTFLCLAGAILSSIAGKMPWQRKGISVTNILLRDYTFDNYATVVLISYLYSLIQGVCIGGFFGGFAYWMITDGSRVRLGIEGAALPFSFALALISSRVILEGLILVYRAAQDFSDYAKSRTKQ